MLRKRGKYSGGARNAVDRDAILGNRAVEGRGRVTRALEGRAVTKRIKVVACTGEENTAKYQIPPEIISPGFTVDFETTRFPVWPDNYVDYRLVQLSILDVALSAEREGFDAVFVCDSTDLDRVEPLSLGR